MPIMKYCDRCDRPVPLDHRCWHEGGVLVVGTDNQRRAELNRKHGTKSAYWRKLRLLALERDGFRCTFNHRGCTQGATTVHLAPHLRGDHRIATLDDCRSACRHCHGVEDAPRAASPRR
jgi:5-methylcytosine-specific restriction endonuclease McrA